MLRGQLDVRAATIAAIGAEFAEWLELSAKFREKEGNLVGAAESGWRSEG